MSSITVLLPVYNGARYLKEAIDSILSQTFSDFTLLIIDDASTDTSAEVIQQFRDERIHYVSNNKNLGLIATLNKGIELCNTELLARMDQDDLAVPERLQIQLDYLLANPSASLVASPIIGMTPEGRERDHWQLDFTTRTPEAIRTEMARNNCISHPTILIRSAVLKKYKYQHQQIGSEDWDLWLRLLRDGHRIFKTQEVLLRYRIHPLSVTSLHRNKQHTQIKSALVKWRFFVGSLLQGRLNLFVLRSAASILRDFLYYFRTTGLPSVARQFKWLVTINPFQAWSQSKELHKLLASHTSRHFFFFPYSHIGGAEKVHAAITKASADKKPFVFITGLNDHDSWLAQFGEQQKVLRIAAALYHPFFSKKSKRNILSKIQQQEKAVVLGANNRFFDTLIPFLSSSVKVIDLTHDYDYEGDKEEAEANFSSWLRCNSRVFISRNTLEKCLRFYKNNFADAADENKLLLISNGVTAPLISPVKSAITPFRVLYTGRDTAEKRVDLIFKLADRCQQLNLPLLFVLVGPIEERPAFKHLKNIECMGTITDASVLQNLNAEAHFSIITSVSEGFPMSLMEGMISGCVPIATAVGDIPNHIQQGVNGFISKSLQEEDILRDFTQVFTELLADTNRLQACAVSAEGYARTHFSIQAFEKAWQELLK